MSGERRYPLSEWGAQRLRRRGITPSVAAWRSVAWSTALLLCLYGFSTALAAFAETFVDRAGGDVLEVGWNNTATFTDSGSRGLVRPVTEPLLAGFRLICGVAVGIVALALLLRVSGLRPHSQSSPGWREASFAGLIVTAAGAAIFAIGVWLAPEAISRATLANDALSGTPVEQVSDWWPTLVVATTLLGCVVAAIHQWAARLDFQDRWRMTERERRDELRDTQMSPDVRRAISRQSNQL